jgi:hypothetical protein
MLIPVLIVVAALLALAGSIALDSHLADFVHTVRPPQPSTLAGFSSGGGSVARG